MMLIIIIALKTDMQQLELGFTLPQYLALGCTKLSVVFFYRRIFRGHVFEILSWALVGLSALWTVAWFFVGLFQCGHHIDYLWGYKEAYSESCLPTKPLFVVSAVTDIFLDLCIMALPIPLVSSVEQAAQNGRLLSHVPANPIQQVWQLQMPVKQKISVSAIFALATL